jgi:site-specific DNA recombinase
MKALAKKVLRCAIYTRVSTDAGLEQDFNSLDAQREASEAYIKSQSHEGWRLVRAGYDDGGFSGGSLERPALQRLLGDVRLGHVDVIVVYKVDRLTRSLADFAKLVELFDTHNVSFVSVTQSFNTTSSMGRLTLNVLLSFAQFEREVTGERIRDKIAASKKKGIWVGGNVPLGYKAEDRKLIIEPAEAKTVRLIFERYLALGAIVPLLEELNRKGIKSKLRKRDEGPDFGGIPFTPGPLAYLLKNRVYIGEIKHHDNSYPGEHAAIIDRDTFDAVQARLAAQSITRSSQRARSDALLQGKLFDDAGNIMTPTHTRKKRLRYRYYVSRALVEGRKAELGSIARVPADQIEAKVVEALRALPTVALPEELTSEELRTAVRDKIKRVVVENDRLAIELADEAAKRAKQPTLFVEWEREAGRARREILLPDAPTDTRPIRSERRSTLVRGIAMGRQWLNELMSGKVRDTNEIAKREGRSQRSVHMMLSLAFLAPDIVEAAVEGRLPRGIGMTRLTDLPPSWTSQWTSLGFGRQP